MANAKHEFIRAGHTYFAKRYETEVLAVPVHAYVYVDRDNALLGSRNWRLNHEEEYERMTDAEKNWLSVRFGFFVLISTEARGPTSSWMTTSAGRASSRCSRPEGSTWTSCRCRSGPT